MKEISEVLRYHFVLNLSVRQSGKAAGVSKSVASRYCIRFKELDISIDDFLVLNEMQQEKLFYHSKQQSNNSKKVMPDMNYIHTELRQKKKTKVTLALLHDEYTEAHPLNHYSYTQYREYYIRYLNTLNPSMKQTHIAGEKVFVDYSGLVVPIHNQQTGEIVTSQVFVAVLGASGYTYVHATYSQKQRDFILSHCLCYEFFGGVPKIVVPDNLKSAVIKNNKDGIIVNDSYAALAKHYNMAVEPARPQKPKDKSKAEQGVQGIQRWILARFRKIKFFSVDQLNDEISKALDLYNNKIIRKIKKSRTQLFEELDKPVLQTLPQERHRYRDIKLCRVAQNYHIFLEDCEYSVPFKYLNHQVEVKYSAQTVEVYCKNILIATHPKLHFAGRCSTLTEHMPKDHEYISQSRNPGYFLNWANTIGIETVLWVKDEFNSVTHPPNAYRKLNAILSLATTYGKSELNLSLSYAKENGIYIKHSVIKSILDKKIYTLKAVNNTNSEVTIFNNHDNLRGDTYK